MNDRNVGAIHESHRILQGRKVRVHYCDCGNDIELVSGWANTCGICGAGYDGNGQRSAPEARQPRQ